MLAQPGLDYLTVGSCLSKDSHRTLGITGGVPFERQAGSSEGVIFPRSHPGWEEESGTQAPQRSVSCFPGERVFFALRNKLGSVLPTAPCLAAVTFVMPVPSVLSAGW